MHTRNLTRREWLKTATTLSTVAAISATQPPLASVAGPTPSAAILSEGLGEPPVWIDVDQRALVSRSDLIYHSPVTLPIEGMPVGNGVMGTLVWTTAAAMHLQINRCDHRPASVLTKHTGMTKHEIPKHEGMTKFEYSKEDY